MVLIDAPSIFSGTWSLASGMLSDITKEKVQFTPLSGVKELMEPWAGKDIADWVVARAPGPLLDLFLRLQPPLRPPGPRATASGREGERGLSGTGPASASLPRAAGGGERQPEPPDEQVLAGPRQGALAAAGDAGGP